LFLEQPVGAIEQASFARFDQTLHGLLGENGQRFMRDGAKKSASGIKPLRDIIVMCSAAPPACGFQRSA
jgi:hypothetical protein